MMAWLTTSLLKFPRSLPSAVPFLALAVAAAIQASPGVAAGMATAAPAGHADWADLALDAPVVADVTVRKVTRLGRRLAPDVPTGEVRVLVLGSLNVVLRAPRALPPVAEWLWQGRSADGRTLPFGPGTRVLLFAEASSEPPKKDVQQYRLFSPQGQQVWSSEGNDSVRTILSEFAALGMRDIRVTGIRDAGVTKGPLPGQHTSQFFLTTKGGLPITLVVRRAPGEPATVAATTSEFTENATAIRPHTLLHYALSCGLPETLPAELAEDSLLQDDYAVAKAATGPCDRTLRP